MRRTKKKVKIISYFNVNEGIGCDGRIERCNQDIWKNNKKCKERTHIIDNIGRIIKFDQMKTTVSH